MSSSSFSAARKVFVVGGTGAQGIPVTRGLVKDGGFSVRVLTRDATSRRAQKLKSFNPSHVEFLEGSFASEQTLRAGFQGCYGAFVNIDGFNAGEKTEMFWAIRAYELALEAGIQHYVYGNLDYGYKLSGWNPIHRSGHYDGKGRIGEWLLFQAKDAKLNRPRNRRTVTTIFTTGPYIEMAIAGSSPMTPAVEEGVVTWRMPLGDGAVPHVALDDCEAYVRWIFDHPQEADAFDLQVAIAHISYQELAEAFSKVTGHPACYVDISLDEYWKRTGWHGAGAAQGYNAPPDDPATMTYQRTFTGFWNNWKYSGQNTGVVQRDYELLDRIFPGRVKSAEEYFQKEDTRGREEGLGGLWERVQKKNLRPILKLAEDGRKGKL